MSECEEIAKNIYRLKTKKIQSLKNAEMKTTRYEDLSLNHPDFCWYYVNWAIWES